MNEGKFTVVAMALGNIAEALSRIPIEDLREFVKTSDEIIKDADGLESTVKMLVSPTLEEARARVELAISLLRARELIEAQKGASES